MPCEWKPEPPDPSSPASSHSHESVAPKKASPLRLSTTIAGPLQSKGHSSSVIGRPAIVESIVRIPSRPYTASTGTMQPRRASTGPTRPSTASIGGMRPSAASTGPTRPYTAPTGPTRPSTAPTGPTQNYAAPTKPKRPHTAPTGPKRPYTPMHTKGQAKMPQASELVTRYTSNMVCCSC